MRRLRWALVCLTLAFGIGIAVPEAQGRFWVLVNGALRYTGIVQINGPLTIQGAGGTGAVLTNTSSTTLTASGPITASGFTLSSTSGSFSLASRGFFSATGADGLLQLTSNGFTIGVVLKVDALPTVASGFGTSPSITAGSTPFAGSVNVGTGGAATSGVINFAGTAYPSAPFCLATPSLTNVPTRATTISTTQLTLTTTTAWTASDIVGWICISAK